MQSRIEGKIMQNNITRRDFVKNSAQTAAAASVLTSGIAAKPAFASGSKKPAKKVIIIGFDGMDPALSEQMMDEGLLPNFDSLRKRNGYRKLASSIPPQSPVAWSNFINGAGPGTHGIFDFIHRNPERQAAPFYSGAETTEGEYMEVGKYRLQLDFWPFNHKPSETLLRRQGTPFWDYLDKAGISSTFYNLPSNYPPSESKYGNHRCLAGMGTPDLEGNYGGHHLFSEDGPVRMKEDGGCKRSMLFFEEKEMASGKMYGPTNTLLKKPAQLTIDFIVHRDIKANAGVIEIQDKKIILKPGQWSKWITLDFEMEAFGPNPHLSGICRFYLQEVAPNFRLYASPINTDPADPAITITEPPKFIEKIAKKLGKFYTTGFQEDYKALNNKVFTDDEFETQANMVLAERLNLLDYALKNYDDGLLYFYFSSTDLQSHMFWWDSDEKHPVREDSEAKKYFGHLKELYQKMDSVMGDILKRYGKEATVIAMSDHGFANFKRQFNLNSWLRKEGYLGPDNAKSVLADVDWSKTRAYGLGINGLYLNMIGRERNGIVAEGSQREELLNELVEKLQAVKDTDGTPIIRNAYRSDKVYKGDATRLAPDIIVGYRRGCRASWDTCLGNISDEILSDNDSAWSADHCADPLDVPGVLFSNKPISADETALIDIAPSILTEYGLEIPKTMQGKNIFS